MRILTISTYPPIECGIATYTHWLRRSLHKLPTIAVTVVTPQGATGDDVLPIYEPDTPTSLERIQHLISQRRPDIIHIQHEYGLFGANRGSAIVDLLALFRCAELPIVTTLHTVNTTPDTPQSQLLKRIVDESSRVIVHEGFQRRQISQFLGGKTAEKIDVIEHGIRSVERPPHPKQRLGWTRQKVVLLCGYIRPRKAFHCIMDLFPDIVAAVPNARLVIASKLRRPGEFVDYYHSLLAQIENSPCSDHISVVTGELPHDQIDTLISAADVVVLPYEQGAQSGILANALAFGRAVVTSNLPAFEAIVNRVGAGIVARDRKEFVQAITRILSDTRCRKDFQALAVRYARSAPWDLVSQMHLQTYQFVVRDRQEVGSNTLPRR